MRNTPFHAAYRASLPLLMFAVIVFDLPQSGSAEAPTPDGLVLWLDAGDTNGDGRIEGEPLSGTPLQVWRDKSPAGNDVRQDAKQRQPVVIADALGAQPVVRFSASSLERTQLSGFRGGDQRFQIFAVMQAAPQDAGSPRLLDIPTQPVYFAVTGQYFWKRRGFWVGSRDLAGSEGKLRLAVHVGDEGQSRQTAWDETPQLLEAVYAGNQQWGLYQNGLPAGRGRFEGDNTFIGFEGGARLAIGQRFGSSEDATWFHGDLAEVLIYDRVLKFDEQRRVGQYLATKYAVETAYSGTVPTPNFESGIQPILARSCFDCHGDTDPDAALDLTSISGLLRGGASGPVMHSGQATDSLLLYMIATGAMPPAGQGAPLADDDIQRVRHWIDAGAPSDTQMDPPKLARGPTSDHWSFQQLRRPDIPSVSDTDRVRTAVDAFVLSKLEARGLRFSRDADRVTLIRRAQLDLIGLLPAPQEVDRFVSDEAPGAWERLVDRLLESPHFGERWGRHWLDGAGYTDTIPNDNDQAIIKPGLGKWKFRDYVVKAFNEDKPFTEFLTEQLAGDELVDWRNAPRLTADMREQLIATGFLRCSPDTTEANELNTLLTRYAVLHRTCENVAGNLLGLTLQCCRCHDHKFEPLPQRDYYRFSAILAPALNPTNWLQPAQRQLAGLGSTEKAEIEQQTRQFRQRRQQLRERAGNRLLDKELAHLPAETRQAVKTALQLPAEQRDAVQLDLAKKFGKSDEDWTQKVLDSLTDEEQHIDAQCSAGILRLEEQLIAATVQAVYDTGPASRVHVLYRGNYESPRAAVEPGLFRVLTPGGVHLPSIREARGTTSGHRLALARQLTDWESPAGALVARVRVNRVWQQLFGRGLVASPDNFGVSGVAPTHPELLEWLSVYFVRNEGRIKPLLKLLMRSTVYRQSAMTHQRAAAAAGDPRPAAGDRRPADPSQIDPSDTLLWRQRLRRLESEIVRDTILSASGRLDRTIGGLPTEIENRPDGMVIEADSEEDPQADRRWRRSMYLLQRRNYHLSLLAAFDQPPLANNCTHRETSTVVSQSLMMLNDRFVLRQAAFLAERVGRESPDSSRETQIATAFRLVLARAPHHEELQWCGDMHARHVQTYQATGLHAHEARHQALVQICHMLLNTSEFLYTP